MNKLDTPSAMYDHVTDARPIPSEAAFPGILGKLVKELDPWTDADPIAMMMTALARVSVLLNGRHRGFVGGKWRTPQINAVLFGESALGVKGTSNVYVDMVFQKAFPKWSSNHLMDGAPSSGSGLVKRIANMAISADHMISIDDALAKGIIEITEKGELIDRPHLRIRPSFPVLVYEQELAKVLQRAKMDSDYDPYLRTLWQGDDATAKWSNTATVTLVRPVVSWLTHVTPGEFVARLGAAELAGGTFNRFLLLFVKRNRALDWEEEVPPKIIGSLARELAKVIEWANTEALTHVGTGRTRGRMEYSKEYIAYWKKNVHPPLNAIMEGPNKMLREFAGRGRDYVKILSMLFALLDYRTTMEPKDAEAALALVNYTLDGLPIIMDELNGIVSEGDDSVSNGKVIIPGDPTKAEPGCLKAVKEYLIANGPTRKGELTKVLQSKGWDAGDINNAILWHEAGGDVRYGPRGKAASRPATWVEWLGGESEEPVSARVPVQASESAPKALSAPAPAQSAPRVSKPRRKAVSAARPVRAGSSSPKVVDSIDVLADW